MTSLSSLLDNSVIQIIETFLGERTIFSENLSHKTDTPLFDVYFADGWQGTPRLTDSAYDPQYPPQSDAGTAAPDRMTNIQNTLCWQPRCGVCRPPPPYSSSPDCVTLSAVRTSPNRSPSDRSHSQHRQGNCRPAQWTDQTYTEPITGPPP